VIKSLRADGRDAPFRYTALAGLVVIAGIVPATMVLIPVLDRAGALDHSGVVGLALGLGLYVLIRFLLPLVAGLMMRLRLWE